MKNYHIRWLLCINRQIWSGQICLSCGSCDLFLHNFPLPGWPSWLLQGDSTSGRIRSSQLQSIVVEQYAVKSEASRWWQEVLVRFLEEGLCPTHPVFPGQMGGGGAGGNGLTGEWEDANENKWRYQETGVDKVYNELVSIRTPPPFTLPRENSVLCVLTTFDLHFKTDCPVLYNTLVLGAPFASH